MSNEKLTQILKLANIGVWELDLVTDDSTWSMETFHIFGFEPTEDLVSLATILEVIHPEDRAMVQEAVEHARTKRVDITYRIVLKDGTIRFVRSQAMAYMADKPECIVGTIQDVTEQKQLELQLREKTERYESLKKYNTDGICSLDVNGNIMGANPAFCELTGYMLDELIGMPYLKFVFDQDQDWAGNYRPYALLHKTVEISLRHKSGRGVEIRGTSVPIIVHGEVRGIYAIVRDITEQNRIQERLYETDQLFHLITENSMDVISYNSADGVCQYISPSIYYTLGYQPEEIVGTHLNDFYHSDDRVLLSEVAQQIESGRDIHQLTGRVRHKDGSYRWIETTIKVARNEAGRIEQLIAIGRDITPRQQVEAQLIALKNQYELILTAAGEGIYGLNQNGNVTFVNPAAASMLGYTVDELLGTPWHERIHHSRVDGSIYTEDECPIYAALRDGAVHVANDEVFWRKDGTAIEVEYTSTPIMNEKKIVGAVVTFRDVSEKRKAEREMLRSRRSLQHAQHLAKLGYWDWNICDDELFWSDEMFEIWQIDRTMFDGKVRTVRARVHENDREAVQKCIEQAFSGGTFDMEYRIVRPDGSLRYIHAIGEPQFEESGRAVRFFGIVRDVTEQWDAEMALRESQEMLRRSEKLSAVGQLAAGIAHEIRNPLTSLKGFVQLLQQRSSGDNRRYIDVMHGELKRIELILDELLMLAKPQAVKYAEDDVYLLLQEVVSLMGAQANMNNVEICTHFDQNAPLVLCEANQLKQVFINLMKNAIEAMPTGGTLSVQAKWNNDWLDVSFVDEGVGIPADKLPRLGEPFYTTKEKGTGLGLMVSHRIVAEHGGKLLISSEVGHGTTIRILLPTTLVQGEVAASTEKNGFD